MGKRVSAITVAEVPNVFDDPCIQRLAQMGRLPPGADLQVFAKIVRNGVRSYARAARVPSDNDVHREIKVLEKAASFYKCEEVADLLESLSPRARDWLIERLSTPASCRRGMALPQPATLRHPAHQ
jgi:hypothetical protein